MNGIFESIILDWLIRIMITGVVSAFSLSKLDSECGSIFKPVKESQVK